jgi:hypothetical protein
MDKENAIYTIRKNKIMSFAGKLKELEIIMFREINQTQKGKYHMFSLICEKRNNMNVKGGLSEKVGGLKKRRMGGEYDRSTL